jgi:bifunctional non-homologous end joining protein LigD
VAKKKNFRFVVQQHNASRLHYDFRLELGAVLKSWAVPKGPSMNPADKRLAVMVEDHPVSYIDFEGAIPEGNYGAGIVEVWDKGLFFPINKDLEKISEREALLALKNGELKFFLKGEKLEGEFVLVRLKDSKNWLLIKHKDEYAVNKKYDSENFPNASLKKFKNKKNK